MKWLGKRAGPIARLVPRTGDSSGGERLLEVKQPPFNGT